MSTKDQKRTGQNRPLESDGGSGKTLITDELIHNISNALMLGAYPETACNMFGIGRQTFKTWMKRAKENPEEYPLCVKFRSAMQEAMAKAEMRDLQNIDNAANGFPKLGPDGKPVSTMQPDWKASAWKLERRNPQNWGRREAVEISNPSGDLKPPSVIVYIPDDGIKPKKTQDDDE